MSITHLTLLTSRLDFVTRGKKVHIRENGMSRFVLGIDLGLHTLCGQELVDGTHARPERTLAASSCCRRCMDSACTFTGRYGSTAHAWFHEVEVEATQ